ncbi:3-methyl-2-oxobutanoate hydroxymethyltransferase [Rhodophyticola sp. CCM32]|uniref:3-methyl-2-oxobutanoate hydroxymethyltransferase n=1 Tax=Rhodophyticola sp. CCM32 TaxID=2916397 RepID=UPI001AEFD6BC|nr:3-methyl-2-oxobutanoate hydroxymethyltransferase [Rhodophyticola sp. CCM32]
MLKALKGRKRLTMLRYFTLDEAAAAEVAGIGIVPAEVVHAISARLDIMLWSMGSGAGYEAQYLFAEDIPGEDRGHIPRHARIYRNFAAEYDRLQAERIAAFSEFRDDVASGAFPGDRQIVKMPKAELDTFLDRIGG